MKTEKFQITCLCVLILLLIIGCNNRVKLQSEIVSKIESQLGTSDSCFIDLKEFTVFPWDTLYYFSGIIPKSEVKSILQNRFKEYHEFDAALVFLNRGKVVYYEIINSNPEKIIKNEIIINYVDSLRYSKFSFKESKFIARKLSAPQGYCYYKLFTKTVN